MASDFGRPLAACDILAFASSVCRSPRVCVFPIKTFRAASTPARFAPGAFFHVLPVMALRRASRASGEGFV